MKPGSQSGTYHILNELFKLFEFVVIAQEEERALWITVEEEV